MRSEAWRPAAAARNRLPQEAREVARQALRPGCEELAARIRVMPVTEARPRVKNRHGGAPRGERPASWDARRLARRLACRVMCTPNGCLARTRTFLGAPPTPRFGVSEAKLQTPGAKNAPRERDGLFDIVRWELPKTVRQRTASSGCPEPPHPEERACGSAAANQVARARVSKDGAAVHPSCFETPRCARLLSMREESTSDGVGMAKRVHDRASAAPCKARVVAFPCFRPLLLSAAKSSEPRDAHGADFSFSSRRLRE